MLQRRKLILFSLLFIIISCSNYDIYREIKSMYPREDTGIEELIRVDGYYYENSEEVYSPIVFTKNGEMKRYPHIFSSKDNLENRLSNIIPRPGYYEISRDTIKTKWAFQVYRGQYRIHEEHFHILNDSTLKRIYYTTNGVEKEVNSLSDTYNFQAFDVSDLK